MLSSSAANGPWRSDEGGDRPRRRNKVKQRRLRYWLTYLAYRSAIVLAIAYAAFWRHRHSLAPERQRLTGFEQRNRPPNMAPETHTALGWYQFDSRNSWPIVKPAGEI